MNINKKYSINSHLVCKLQKEKKRLRQRKNDDEKSSPAAGGIHERNWSYG